MGFIDRFLTRRHRRRAARLEAESLRKHLDNKLSLRVLAEDSNLLGPDGLPMAGLAGSKFVLGTKVNNPAELVVLERPTIVAAHSVTYGGTGVGKTFLHLTILDQQLRRDIRREERRQPQDTAIIVVEPKHDLAPTFLNLIEHRLRSTSEEVRERILSKLTTFNPSGRYVVGLPLLRPEQDVSPEMHAMSLSGLVGRLSGSPFGPKQRPILDTLLLGFILDGMALPEAVEILGHWERLRAFGLRSRSPLVHGFFEENVRGIPAAVMDGIRARLLRLVFQPNLRAMFSASVGLDFDDMLRPGRISVIDLGGSQGDEDITAFFCGLFVLKLGRAMRRRPNGSSAVILVVDEFPIILQGEGDVAEQVTTLLNTARSRSVAAHLLTQSAASISAVSPRLLHAIHTNCAVEILGATDDARALSDILPVSGRRLREPPMPWESPPASPWLSREEELRLLVEQTQALPARHFWLWRKRGSSKAVLMKSLDFVIPESRGDDLARRVERGRWGHLPHEMPSNRDRPQIVLLGNTPGPSRRPSGL